MCLNHARMVMLYILLSLMRTALNDTWKAKNGNDRWRRVFPSKLNMQTQDDMFLTEYIKNVLQFFPKIQPDKLNIFLKLWHDRLRNKTEL